MASARILVRVSIVVRRHHDHSMGLASSFRGLVHCQYDRKHSGMQADMVLDKELKVLYLDSQAAGNRPSGPGLSI